MLYVTYHHRRSSERELVLPDGAPFPRHLRRDEWFVHATHQTVSGRTEADIAVLGYCDRSGRMPFGRRVGAPQRPVVERKAAG